MRSQFIDRLGKTCFSTLQKLKLQVSKYRSAMFLSRFIRSNANVLKLQWGTCKITRVLYSSQATRTLSAVNSKNDISELVNVFPQIVQDLTEDQTYEDVPQVNKWFAKVLEYNVASSSKSKGIVIPRTYKALADVSELTTENMKRANIMAWCWEMLQALLIVHDDILDSAKIRRCAQSWYNQKGVGFAAINDGVFLENALYSVLKRYFSNRHWYLPCLELFHNITMLSTIGQSLDLILAAEAKSNLNILTLENYKVLAKYKAEYFPFYFPVTLGMYLSNKFDSDTHKQLMPPLMSMGYILMVENDFKDVFDNPTLNGLIGTDISQGRCTWMIATALERATEAQRNILKRHYGKADSESTLIVKNLYEELNLPSICKNHVEEELSAVRKEIQRISRGNPNKLFFEYLDSIVVFKNWEESEYWCT